MKLNIIACLVFITSVARSQNISFNRKMVETLSSPYLWGRGYTNDGMKKVANFLAEEFKTLGYNHWMGKIISRILVIRQILSPGKMDLAINGKSLTPGEDFIVAPKAKE